MTLRVAIAGPIVVRLTGREREMDGQDIGLHYRVNLARQAPSCALYILIVVGDIGSVLARTAAAGRRACIVFLQKSRIDAIAATTSCLTA